MISLNIRSKSAPGNKIWTFSQVALMILLLAPIISMIESHFGMSLLMSYKNQINEK